MQGRGGLQAVAALRGRPRRQRVPRKPARDRRVPAVAGRARVREGERRSGYCDRHLGRRHPARQRRSLSGPRFAVPPHSACRRRQSPAGGWIARAQREPGLLCSTTLKEIEHGEEKSEKRRKEKEEEESITKKEIVEKSRQEGGR